MSPILTLRALRQTPKLRKLAAEELIPGPLPFLLKENGLDEVDTTLAEAELARVDGKSHNINEMLYVCAGNLFSMCQDLTLYIADTRYLSTPIRALQCLTAFVALGFPRLPGQRVTIRMSLRFFATNRPPMRYLSLHLPPCFHGTVTLVDYCFPSTQRRPDLVCRG